MSPERTAAAGIEMVRVFDASRAAVWAAWTEPDQFAAWYGGDGARVTATLDVRPGGRWTADMVTGDGQQIPFAGEYREVVELERLVMTLTDDPAGEAREILTVTFADAGERTEMTFRQSGGNLTPEGYERAKQGWSGFFDSLTRLLDM